MTMVRPITLPLVAPIAAPGTTSSGIASISWTPSSLGAKLVAWWNADDTASGAVSTWTDRKGALAVTAISPNQPTSALTSGFRYLDFDGTDDYLRTTTFGNLPVGATESETWLLCIQNSPTGAIRRPIDYGGQTGAQSRRIMRPTASPSRFQVGNVTTTVHLDTTHTFDGLAVVGAIYLAAENQGRINGELTVPTGTAHGGTMNTPTASANFTIGASSAAPAAQFCQMSLRHALVTLILTVSEREKLEGYLAWDINRADILPVGHPYKSVRP